MFFSSIARASPATGDDVLKHLQPLGLLVLLSGLAGICRDVSGFVRIGPDLSGFAEICWDLPLEMLGRDAPPRQPQRREPHGGGALGQAVQHHALRRIYKSCVMCRRGRGAGLGTFRYATLRRRDGQDCWMLSTTITSNPAPPPLRTDVTLLIPPEGRNGRWEVGHQLNSQ